MSINVSCITPWVTVALLGLLACHPSGQRDIARPDAATADPGRRILVQLEVPERPEQPLRVDVRGAFRRDRNVVRAAPAVVGGYQRMPFGQFLRGMTAYDDRGAPLPVTRVTEGEWRVEGALARLRYEVLTRQEDEAVIDLTVSTHRRAGHGLISGYATHVTVEGFERHPHELTVVVPDGWRVASALRRVTGHPARFTASGSFELMDEPVMVGTVFQTRTIAGAQAGGAVHLYSADSTHTAAQLDTLATAHAQAAQAIAQLGLPPLERPYHVFVELFPPVPGRQYGWAMEHGASMVAIDTEGMFRSGSTRLTYHVAHHLMHSWIPRRLYTASLRPDAQLRGQVTPAIWFAEGLAQYLTLIAVSRAGVIDPDQAMTLLVKRFAERYADHAPPTPRSMADHSRRICEGEHEHWRYGYAAGAMLAFLMDQEMLRASNLEAGLPEAIARVFRDWHDHPEGIPDDRLAQVLGQAGGVDLTKLFATHVDGATPLDIARILAPLEIEMEMAISPAGDRHVIAAEPSPSAAALRAAIFQPSD